MEDGWFEKILSGFLLCKKQEEKKSEKSQYSFHDIQIFLNTYQFSASALRDETEYDSKNSSSLIECSHLVRCFATTMKVPFS